MPEASDLCSKCLSEAVTDDFYPRWCKGCRASYQRENKVLTSARTEKRGFSAGIQAMREHLAGEFDRLGSGIYKACEVAKLIRQATPPRPD